MCNGCAQEARQLIAELHAARISAKLTWNLKKWFPRRRLSCKSGGGGGRRYVGLHVSLGEGALLENYQNCPVGYVVWGLQLICSHPL